MTIDLKWGLPFVLPFALLLMSRGLAWVAGIEWDGNYDAGTVAWVCAIVGVSAGVFAAAAMDSDDIRWNITIGGRK